MNIPIVKLVYRHPVRPKSCQYEEYIEEKHELPITEVWEWLRKFEEAKGYSTEYWGRNSSRYGPLFDIFPDQERRKINDFVTSLEEISG